MKFNMSLWAAFLELKSTVLELQETVERLTQAVLHLQDNKEGCKFVVLDYPEPNWDLLEEISEKWYGAVGCSVCPLFDWGLCDPDYKTITCKEVVFSVLTGDWKESKEMISDAKSKFDEYRKKGLSTKDAIAKIKIDLMEALREELKSKEKEVPVDRKEALNQIIEEMKRVNRP